MEKLLSEIIVINSEYYPKYCKQVIVYSDDVHSSGIHIYDS